jgi:hypothetical protein
LPKNGNLLLTFIPIYGKISANIFPAVGAAIWPPLCKEPFGFFNITSKTILVFSTGEIATNEAGSNSFTLSPSKWIETVNAKGIVSKLGKNGGTFAHKDIAFEFASWVSASFKLYLIKEIQRLKEDENNRLHLEWNLQRTISKINYHIHTDAIKENLIPQEITKQQSQLVYANEADLLNVALFGVTAKTWRDNNPDQKGNIRDYATLEQLVVLSNMESINALLIQQGVLQSERLIQLNKVAITQMKSLLRNPAMKKLK